MNCDPVEYISVKLTGFLLCDSSIREPCCLIKKQTNKLSEKGDFSFPVSCSNWHKFISKICGDSCKDVFEHVNDLGDNVDAKLQRLVKISSSWQFSIRGTQIANGRCGIFLNRPMTFKYSLFQILKEKEFLKCTKNTEKKLYLEDVKRDSPSITLYRVELVRKVLENLAKYSEWELVTKPSQASLELIVQCSNKFSVGKENAKYIRCGVVLDPENQKLATITYTEYKSLRSKDMRLMAMHKYGARVRDSIKFRNLVDNLGKAAVIVDLLEVKHSSSVKIIRNGHGSSKGAAFILYNSARLEALITAFDERVKQGKYPPLPPLEEIDITILNEEEEWLLLFNYILSFPNLIKRCLNDLGNGSCAPHLVCQYLSGFVAVFSIYYRRIRILIDNRPHLVPAIHARIYFVKCIQEILNIALSFLNISPVQCM